MTQEGEGSEGETSSRDTPIARAINAFGGLRPMAAKLGVPVTTVQGWKERGHIPAARIPEVLGAARQHGIMLGEAELAADAEAKSSEESAPPQSPAAQPGAAADVKPTKEKAEELGEPTGAASRQTRRAIAAALWATAVAALVLAGALSLPYWGPQAGLEPAGTATGALAGRVSTLENRVAQSGISPDLAAKLKQLADAQATNAQHLSALERSFAELAAKPSGGGADPEKLTALADQVSALKSENGTLSQQVIALGQRLAAIEKEAQQNREADSRRAALVLAVGQLEQALTRSTPYDQPLAAVASLAQDDQEIKPALDALKPRAARGIPTAAELTSRFDSASIAAAQAALVPERPGLAARALAELSRLVVIRRTDTSDASQEPDAVLARAEALLKRSDLAGAVNALAALQGAPAKAMAPWLADARARLDADEALRTIAARAIARLGEAHS